MLVVGLVLGIGYLRMIEERLIFFPERQLAATPADIGLDYTERRFVAADNVELHGWYMPHAEARWTVLHMHGNAGNISHRLHLYRRWHDMGLSVFGFDYRGYGASAGKPSEHGLYADAQAAWNELTERLQIPPGRVILAGRSIGCAMAATLAAQKHAAALVLETPFTNIADMTRFHYPWLPAGLVRSRFDTRSAIPKVHVPLLVIEAGDDSIVPAGMAARLLALANEPKVMISLPGDHNDFDVRSEAAYIAAWRRFLAGLG